MLKKLVWLILLISVLLLLVPPWRSAYSAPIEPTRPDIRTYAQERVIESFGGGWVEFDAIIKRESRWISTAQNPRSTAYGYGQFLNSTWKIVGCKKTSDPYVQIDCTIKYVKKVYGSPQKALAFHKRKGYY